jgi:hypothetical protein
MGWGIPRGCMLGPYWRYGLASVHDFLCIHLFVIGIGGYVPAKCTTASGVLTGSMKGSLILK